MDAADKGFSARICWQSTIVWGASAGKDPPFSRAICRSALMSVLRVELD